MTATREIHLAARPDGWPTAANFAVVDRELPAPADGQVLVRNVFMSVDPYMRPRMNDVKSYVPPFQVGEALDGGAVGEVLESRVDGLAPGDLVVHRLGWREHAVVDRPRKLEPLAGVSPSHYLGVLGTTGLTAYVGLLDIAGFRPGDAVFVSGAAGAVGSVAGQIARLRGASRVIGSAGSAEKVALLRDKLGFDAAFDYRDGHLYRQLTAAAPEGIDVYFDNVGGEHLEAAIGVLNDHGRVALCGSISAYNDAEPKPGPKNLGLAVGKRLSLRGFIVTDHAARTRDMIREVGGWLADGQLVAEETVVDGGLDAAVDAFLGMLRGENTGKMVVRF
ncbi:NADP-dependent oxidoreductase [Actinophytocola xinjiangensis]|uniref:NADP-dependent oxidoreductase n=1 Tax=Actinophytocola xinjiangensis TaxID=485602 RepID=A0A7Z0WTM0_9PSEU|nr:NADP-dependent oxidoreductase [Actinophytocola xinjiangensis]OLF13024.1 NADP-dependent oxidoreductase [Actinophytocola xinjiangensis]